MSNNMTYVKKIKKIILWSVPLFMATCGVWYFLSDYALMSTPLSEDKPDNPRFYADILASLEPRAIPVLIEEIRKHPVGDRGFMHYSNALNSFGLNGKGALLKEIDGNNNPREQFRLIIALQKAFNDYSRLSLWVDKAVYGDYNFMQLVFMSDAVSKTYAGAPSLRNPKNHNSLNPEFRDWWMVRNTDT